MPPALQFWLYDFDDLADIHSVGGLRAEEPGLYILREAVELHVLMVELPAQEGLAGLGEGNGFAAGDSGEPRLGLLVAVPAGLGAHKAQGLLIFAGIEGHGKILVLFKIAVGVAVGPDVDRGDRLVPQTADAAQDTVMAL